MNAEIHAALHVNTSIKTGFFKKIEVVGCSLRFKLGSISMFEGFCENFHYHFNSKVKIEADSCSLSTKLRISFEHS